MTAFGGRTVGTSIRGGNQLHSFDLASDDLTPILTSLGPFSHAMLLGAVATPDACFEDPDHSRRVNVDGMIRGIKTLQKFNIKPIFTSTEAVFDGQVGPYTETDIPKPIVAYGQQKREVEVFLEQHCPEAIVVRIARVFSSDLNDSTLLSGLLKQLLDDKAIRCATDQIMSPIHITELTDAFVRLLTTPAKGIYHFSGKTIASRFEIACMLLEELQRSRPCAAQIQPCFLSQFNTPEPRPRNTALTSVRAPAAWLNARRPLRHWCSDLVTRWEGAHAVH